MSAYRLSTRKSGFTLAELLIALAILGVIATFTIPKVLQSQQDNRKNAMAKEVMAMVSAAQAAYRQDHDLYMTDPWVLTPYFNYVRMDTSSSIQIDSFKNDTSRTCGYDPCFILHNGGVLMPYVASAYIARGLTNAQVYYFDPDGQYSGSSTGPGKGIAFLLFYNGKITTFGKWASAVQVGGATWYPGATDDPDWFSW